MPSLSIGEVAKRTGLRTSALRYYESAGLLPAPDRVSGRRVYSPDVIRLLGVLRAAQEAGFTLREIGVLISAVETGTPLSVRWRAMARTKVAELDERAKRIEGMRRALARSLECACLRIEDCTLAPAAVPLPRGKPGRGR